MDTYFSALIRYRLLVLSALAVGALASVALARFVPTLYWAQATVLMVADPSGRQQLVPESPIKPIVSSDLPVLATTPAVLERVADDLHLPGDPSSLQRLQKSIKAKLTGVSSILAIRFNAGDEPRAVAGANAVATEVASFYRATATRRFALLAEDLKDQLQQRQATLAHLNHRIARTTALYPYVDLKDGGQPFSVSFAKLIDLRNDARAALASDDAAEAQLRAHLSSVLPIARHEAEQSDPVFGMYQQHLTADLGALASDQAHYTDRYPGLPEIRATVKVDRAELNAQSRITSSAATAQSATYARAQDDDSKAIALKRGDEAKLKSITADLEQMKAQLEASSGEAATQASLVTQRDAAAMAYTDTSERLVKILGDEAEAGSVGSVMKLDRAVFAEQVAYTSKHLVYAVGICISVLFALVLPLLIEPADTRLGRPGVAEEVYGAPLIGILK